MTTYIKQVLDQSNNEILPVTTTTAVLNSDGTTVLENRLQSIESLLVDFNGLHTGLVPVPVGYSENLGAIYMKGDGQWSEFATDVNTAVANVFIPLAGGAMTGGTSRYITNMTDTLPSGADITNLSSTHRGYVASMGMVVDNFLPLKGGTMDREGSGINMSGTVLTGLTQPVTPEDAANKKFVDDLCGNNRAWSNQDHLPSLLDGSKAVQAAYVYSSATTAQNTLAFGTAGMVEDTTCHIFVYGGTENSMSCSGGLGTLIIPFNKTAAGTTVSQGSNRYETIIVDGEVVFNQGAFYNQNSNKSITMVANKIVEISVMYQKYQSENETYHRTIIKTDYHTTA
jgi:hypothetical protein